MSLYTSYWRQLQMPVEDCLDFDKIKLFLRVWPYTMLSYERLSNAYMLSNTIEAKRIHGAFVECGVWKAGCIGVMAYNAYKAGSNRKIWLFDSFAGLPEPTEIDGYRAIEYASSKASHELYSFADCVASIEDVNKLLFSILKLDRNNIRIEKGWFQSTIPKAKSEIGEISILRLDCDWYESIKCCLENLYDHIVPGGFVIVDDYYYWLGCKKAIDEFMHNMRITVSLNPIASTAMWFQKPG